MSVYKSVSKVTIDGISPTTTVDVSGDMPDATQAIWDLYDPTGVEQEGVITITDQGTVTIQSAGLPAGEYTLVGLA